MSDTNVRFSAIRRCKSQKKKTTTEIFHCTSFHPKTKNWIKEKLVQALWFNMWTSSFMILLIISILIQTTKNEKRNKPKTNPKPHPHLIIVMNSMWISAMGSPYYRDMDEPTSPAGAGHHRSRSASRPPMSHAMDYPSNNQSRASKHHQINA